MSFQSRQKCMVPCKKILTTGNTQGENNTSFHDIKDVFWALGDRDRKDA